MGEIVWGMMVVKAQVRIWKVGTKKISASLSVSAVGSAVSSKQKFQFGSRDRDIV